MAASKAFNIPELFEMMLEGVDPKTLLLVQRVNKSWRDQIRISLLLRKVLFYAAEPQEHVWILDRDDGFAPWKAPWKWQLIDRVPVGTEEAVTAKLHLVQAKIITPVRFNPLLLKEDGKIERRKVHFSDPDINPTRVPRQQAIGGLELRSGLRASQVDMFLTQPPCTEVEVSMVIEMEQAPAPHLPNGLWDCWEPKRQFLQVQSESGVTLKHVLDAGIQGLDVNNILGVSSVRIRFLGMIEPTGAEVTKSEADRRRREILTNAAILKNRKAGRAETGVA